MNAFPLSPDAACGSSASSGNASPVMREILQALRELAADGREGVIDLFSLPFGPGDERALRSALGIGEVCALVKALGESEVEETAYPGVWWVEHRGSDGQVIAKTVEITRIPRLLCSQPEDVAQAVSRLEAALGAAADAGGE